MIRTPNSTLPPLLNAIEAFTVLEFPQSETDATDGMPMIIASIHMLSYIHTYYVVSSIMLVVAIQNIETSYGLSKISWQGDPCVPQQFLWDGLTCEYSNMSTPPKIISLYV